MKDEQCVRFLQWAMPQLSLRWSGFRKVRKQVCKRVGRRIRNLGLAGAEQYKTYLQSHSDEWAHLDKLCRITISRFYRDRGVFTALAQEVLPSLATRALERGDTALHVWSAGCGFGEEPYTLAILWSVDLQTRFPDVAIDVVATDADATMLERALEGRYEFGSLKALPESWRNKAFELEDHAYNLRPEYRKAVSFLEQDIRERQPEGPFDLVLCRNLAFTYFDDVLQRQTLQRIVGLMRQGAALVLGIHERLPADARELSIWFDKQRIYRKCEPQQEHI